MKLYELTDQYRCIMDSIADSDGELTPALETALMNIEGDLDAKVNGVCGLIQEITRCSEAAKAESDRLARLAQIRENIAKRLKTYLFNCLEGSGLQRHETDLFRVRIQKNSRPSIRWTRDITELPALFRRVRMELDSDVVLDSIKAGRELPPGFEVLLGSHLRIS